eukprot:UN27028
MAESGYVNGQYNAGWLIKNEELNIVNNYTSTHSITEDDFAFRYYHQAAQQEDSESQRIIGDYFY